MRQIDRRHIAFQQSCRVLQTLPSSLCHLTGEGNCDNVTKTSGTFLVELLTKMMSQSIYHILHISQSANHDGLSMEHMKKEFFLSLHAWMTCKYQPARHSVCWCVWNQPRIQHRHKPIGTVIQYSRHFQKTGSRNNTIWWSSNNVTEAYQNTAVSSLLRPVY